MNWVKNVEEVFISNPFFSIIEEQGKDKKETTPAVLFYFYFTGISLITRAGLPPNTTLSPKDLVITAPAPATTLFPSVTPGRTMTLPPAQKLSPIVIGLPYSIPEFRHVDPADEVESRTDSWDQSWHCLQYESDKHPAWSSSN